MRTLPPFLYIHWDTRSKLDRSSAHLLQVHRRQCGAESPRGREFKTFPFEMRHTEQAPMLTRSFPRSLSRSTLQVSIDDNESIDKSSLYHEPFNVNMYTSAASGCSMSDMQRHHITPDYTGKVRSIRSHPSVSIPSAGLAAGN